MAKATFHRVEKTEPGTAVFQIKGRVGFRENEALQKLVTECQKHNFDRVVFDLTDLESLGGKGARILRDFAKEMDLTNNPIRFVITSPHIKKFLLPGGSEPSGEFFVSLDEALRAPHGSADAGDRTVETDFLEKIEAAMGDNLFGAGAGGADEKTSAHVDAGEKSGAETRAAEPKSRGGLPPEKKSPGRKTEGDEKGTGGTSDSDPIAMGGPGKESFDSDKTIISPPRRASASEGKAENPRKTKGRGKPEKTQEDEDLIFTDRRSSPRPTVQPEAVGLEQKPEKVLDDLFQEYGAKEKPVSTEDHRVDLSAHTNLESQELKRQVLALKNLLASSSEFNSIRDKERLLDLFLLSSISLGGVQSAAFFRLDGSDFRATASKGCDLAEIGRIPLEGQYAAVAEKAKSSKVLELAGIGMSEEIAHALSNAGFRFGIPFRVKGHLMGLVLFGDLISQSMNRDLRFDLISILCNQAAIAYENAFLFEEQHDRTLGVVKTLVKMIEKNTLTAGTAEHVSRYAGVLARRLNYPDDYFRDLIYGTVLRDIGMVEVSDLIIRSPRELTEDEWEVIKQHPRDGAEMLRRMKFSEHTCEIVLCHHERFNGEGYPNGLRGRAIPLGARVVSVVESFIAMLHDRPSRPALSAGEAIDSIADNWGNRYDPQVLETFVALIRDELQTKEVILQETPGGTFS